MKHPVTTTEVYLPSLTLGNRRATKHVYSHSECVTLRSGGINVTGVGHFYRCTETGSLRRWGFDAGYGAN